MNALGRTVVACLALFQVGATTALTYAESIQDAERIGSPIHVESPGNADCDAHHSSLFCNAMRVLLLAKVPGQVGKIEGAVPGIRSPAALPASVFSPASTRLAGPVVPRAPPRV